MIYGTQNTRINKVKSHYTGGRRLHSLLMDSCCRIRHIQWQQEPINRERGLLPPMCDFNPLTLRDEPHSWWIRPLVSVLSRLQVVYTIVLYSQLGAKQSKGPMRDMRSDHVHVIICIRKQTITWQYGYKTTYVTATMGEDVTRHNSASNGGPRL